MIESIVVQHLKAGIIGPFPRKWGELPDYSAFAAIIIEKVEIPARASPLQGTTLATLIGGSGSAVATLEIFQRHPLIN